jgi:MFS family permease
MVVGGILTGLAGILCAIAPSFLILLGLLLMMGVGIAMPTPAGSVAVRSAFPLHLRGMVMGVRQTGVPVGGFFAALILPSVAIAHGWQAAVAGAGGACIAIALIGLAAYGSGARMAPSETGSLSLLHVLTRDITVAAIGGFLLVGGQICLLTYLVVYLIHDRHLTITAAAFILAMAQVSGAVGRIFWGAVSDRLRSSRRRITLMLAGGTGGVAALFMAFLPNSAPLSVLVVIILICAVGSVGWNGVQNTFFSELATPGSEGRSVGLGQMIQQPGVLIGPFLFGLVVDLTGSFRPAWLLAAGMLMAATLVMSRAREPIQVTTLATVDE